MIRVRDDDVLIDSSGHDSAFLRFKQTHEWITSAGFMHVPAILVHNNVEQGHRGIKGFPEAISYIREYVEEGSMAPQIHGWEHVDYGKKSCEQVIEDIGKAKDFLFDTWGVEATKWYTPWGASQPHLWEAAANLHLELVDCSRISKLEGQYGVVARLKAGEKLEDFMGDQEIFYHWWVGGARLLRVCEVAKHGSWEAAKAANPKLFRE